ncbi:MAG: hypothetical protein SGI91_01650 [Alphaproteobacteria bacterium]|nr:hypothetical protein [Alphaproteobacteria bacterium]
MNLPDDVLRRSFVASNGERAFALEDVDIVLRSYEAARTAVFGWEAWIVDHAARPSPAFGLEPAPGRWCGLIPTPDGGSAVIGGSCHPGADGPDQLASGRTIEEAREQLKLFCDSRSNEVAKAWLPFLRINFTT